MTAAPEQTDSLDKFCDLLVTGRYEHKTPWQLRGKIFGAIRVGNITDEGTESYVEDLKALFAHCGLSAEWRRTNHTGRLFVPGLLMDENVDEGSWLVPVVSATSLIHGGAEKWTVMHYTVSEFRKYFAAVSDVEDLAQRPDPIDMKSPKPDMVNHPPHYTGHPSGIECVEIAESAGFNIGNAIKYLWRYCWGAGEKSRNVEDLEKALWYIVRERDGAKR